MIFVVPFHEQIAVFFIFSTVGRFAPLEMILSKMETIYPNNFLPLILVQ